MKRKSRKQLLRSLNRAVEAQMPDLLEQISSAPVRKMEEMDFITAQPASPDRKRNSWIPRMAAVCCMLLLTLAGGWFWQTRLPYSLVDLDVNPSIQLTASRSDRILKAEAFNSQAQEVLGEMDLRGVPLDVGVNAIIGSMVTQGYLNEQHSTVLVTVQSSNQQKAVEMTASLAGEISQQLTTAGLTPKVLSHASPMEEKSQGAAVQGISPGRVALIEHILAQKPEADRETLYQMSVDQLLGYCYSNHLDLSDFTSDDPDDEWDDWYDDWDQEQDDEDDWDQEQDDEDDWDHQEEDDDQGDQDDGDDDRDEDDQDNQDDRDDQENDHDQDDRDDGDDQENKDDRDERDDQEDEDDREDRDDDEDDRDNRDDRDDEDDEDDQDDESDGDDRDDEHD